MTVRRSRTWGSGPAHDRRPFFAPRRRGASSGIGEASPGRPGGTRRLSPGLPHPARDCCARRNNRACSACTGNGCPAHGVAPSKRPAIFTRSCSGRSVPGTEGRVARSRILRDLATNGRRGCRPRGTRGIRRPDAEPAATVSCPDLWGRSAYRAVNGFALGVCSSRPNPVAVAIGAAGSSLAARLQCGKKVSRPGIHWDTSWVSRHEGLGVFECRGHLLRTDRLNGRAGGRTAVHGRPGAPRCEAVSHLVAVSVVRSAFLGSRRIPGRDDSWKNY